MQISDHETDEDSLAAFGAEAVTFLCCGDIMGLVTRFDYALAAGREPVSALRGDLASCLDELQASRLVHSGERITATVKYFGPNDSGLFALVECLVPTDRGRGVLVELIVTSTSSSKHICLEGISAVA
jgi:hypothetical protein